MVPLKKGNDKLRYQREVRGWSQAVVAMKIGTATEVISRWETGGRTPGRFYQTKLCELFEQTAEELGFVAPIEGEKTAVVVEDLPNDAKTNYISVNHLSTAISQGIIEAVKDMGGLDMESTRREALKTIAALSSGAFYTYQTTTDIEVLERLSKALKRNPSGLDQQVLESLEAVVKKKRLQFASSEGQEWKDILQDAYGTLSLITQHLERSQPPKTYARLCNLASETSYLIGNIFYNEGRYEITDRYYAEALEAAKEAKNDALSSVIFTGRGLVSIYIGEPLKGLPFLEQAKILAARTSSHDMLRTWICAVHSEIHARSHNYTSFLQEIENAKTFLARNNGGIAPLSFEDAIIHAHISESKLFGFEGIGYIQFNKSVEAQKALTTQLNRIKETPNASRLKDQSVTLVDLGLAYTQQAEIKAACDCIGQALDCIQVTGLTSSFQRVVKIKQELKPWERMPQVKSLNEQMAHTLTTLQGGYA
ncbi:helix-turn-helix domain-containing protein [Tengunoibacter tsumagoiensis]|uniref:HTH cro/C1-type domain-containing protein n=1 Tax=Tengunoibacter tsumagoiensis TaxID=2014871 RepID=A0A402A7Z2_9CHLR|nr:helix-turn-helix transcriptional regulator [Tengunoibacter tsumagoiensis]GCE15101.1 hypothetical protein KTT_49600 [Tengunoibacter tsumagoiensis]